MISGLSPVLAYMVSLVGAIFISVITPSWLVWRLMLLVPLAGEVVIFGCGLYGSEPIGWSQVGAVLIYAVIGLILGIILVGPAAIVLGGLGWMFVRAKILRLNLPDNTSFLIGSLTGGVVGCGVHIFTYAALFHQWRGWADGDARFVFAACAVGGAVGGSLIGLYATKQSLPISSSDFAHDKD
jgi:hypothetical protein